MEHESPEPISPALALPAPATRHDGWSGEKIAKFCETLAETAVVAEACDQAGMGISGAYALRRRNPLFAAAWDAALTIARERLADTLLARSIEGNIEQIWRGGELVGERHAIDNRLGLAILRRLDRLAETGTTVGTRAGRAPAPVRPERSRAAPAPRSQPFDWDMMLDALRTGDPDAVAAALAMAQGDKVEEVEDPRAALAGRAGAGGSPDRAALAGRAGAGGSPDDDDNEPDEPDLSCRCWKDENGVWMTDFAPPEGFDLYRQGEWGRAGYERECTREEAELLDADAACAVARERAKDESLRDGLFELIRQEIGDSARTGDEA